MMFAKIQNYRNIPFSEDTPYVDFYKYSNVKDLAYKCEMCRDQIVRCRTVGILSSEHGRFYLADMDESGVQSAFKIQVSLVYYLSKCSLASTITPYPVQVFGTLQWKNRPVIFIKLLQVLNIPIAIRIRDIMSTIVAKHLAINQEENSHYEGNLTIT